MNRTSATISWTLDKPSTGQVEYGTTSELGLRTRRETSPEYTTHVQELEDLRPGTTYHYRVRSTDRSGIETVSERRTFTTDPAAAEATPTPRPDPTATPRPGATATPRPDPTATPRPAPTATPRPAPTATPRPAPTATPRPAPTATPRPAPTQAPDPGSVTVPSSIDSSGGSDVSSALQRFVDGVPNGSTISFRSGTYRLSRGINLRSRSNLVFDGNGATLRITGAGASAEASAFNLSGGDRAITIREFDLVGNNADAGTADAYDPGADSQMGVLIRGGTDILIEDVTMQRFWGDCMYVGTSGSAWSDGVTFRDSTCSLTGRNGVTIIAGRDVTIERVRFDGIGTAVVDMEPNYGTDGASRVMIRDNTIGTYGHNDRYTSWVLAAVGADGAVMEDVSLIGNRISGIASSGVRGDPRGLHVRVDARGPRRDFVVRDNVSTRTVAGPSINFTGVNGVTVTGNTQPLSSGSLARFTSSSNVTYQP